MLQLPTVNSGSIGTVLSIDLPSRQCVIDFATGFVGRAADGGFIGDVYHAKLEEVEVVQVNEDVEGEEDRKKVSMEATRARAAVFQKQYSRDYARRQKELLPPGGEDFLRQSLPELFRDGARRDQSGRSAKGKGSFSHSRPRSAGASGEASAYLILQEMDARARRSFKTQSALFSGSMDGVRGLTVEQPYIEHEINACNVRIFLRDAYEQLAEALRLPVHGEQREETETKLEVQHQREFVRSHRFQWTHRESWLFFRMSPRSSPGSSNRCRTTCQAGSGSARRGVGWTGCASCVGRQR